MVEVNRVGSLAKTLVRCIAPMVAAIVLSCAVGVSRASADVSYSSYTLIGDTVQITGPGIQVTGGAGLIELHTTTGSTLLAWCIDIYDQLQHSGKYAPTPNGPINGVSNPAAG